MLRGLCPEFSQPAGLNASLTSGQGPLQADGARRGTPPKGTIVEEPHFVWQRRLLQESAFPMGAGLGTQDGRRWGTKEQRAELQGRDWGAQKQQEEDERNESSGEANRVTPGSHTLLIRDKG